MTPLRQAIFEILQAHHTRHAVRWSSDFRPSRARLPASQELSELNNFFFCQLGRIPRPTDLAKQCLLGNGPNTDHWLRDFANVVAPLLIAWENQIYPPVHQVDKGLTELGSLLGSC